MELELGFFRSRADVCRADLGQSHDPSALSVVERAKFFAAKRIGELSNGGGRCGFACCFWSGRLWGRRIQE